jgi:hypothetical protein
MAFSAGRRRRSSAPELPPGALGGRGDAELGVTAVTEGAVARGTAVASKHGLRRVQFEDVRGLATALMTAVAEVAVLAQPAGAEGMGAGGQVEDCGMGRVAHQGRRRFRRLNVPAIVRWPCAHAQERTSKWGGYQQVSHGSGPGVSGHPPAQQLQG